MTLVEILKADDEFTDEQLAYIIESTNNKEDYITLNYIEKRLISVQGKDFVVKNHFKIQYIMSLILKKDINLLFEFYDGCFQEYMKATDNNYSNISVFNLTFVVLINIAVKIIREYKD